MDRRTFVKSVLLAAGVSGAGGVLAACGRGQEGIPSGDPSLNVVSASFEILTGQGRRFAFGVSDFNNVPVKDRALEVYVTDLEGEVLSGPHSTQFYDEGGAALGLYVAQIDVVEPGPVLIAAVDGDQFGHATINVVRPEDSQLPVPDGDAIVVPTPTVEDEMGLTELCTQQPDCGMHEVSLDAAVADSRPVVLMFATPAYCQTAVCGPAVNVLDEVRQAGDWDDAAFIHVEIFSDAGQTLTEPVEQWGLPSEPWLFTIGPEGTIVDRLDGPMIRAELERLDAELTDPATG
jgi:hypothetical protein